MIKLLILLFLTISMVYAKAQRYYSISGQINDTHNGIVAGANVFLFGSRDSIYTMSDESGNFFLNKFRDSIFTLKITRLGYAVWQDTLVANKCCYDIVLTENSNLLKEIVVKGRSTPRLKGDTLEYVARDYQRSEEDVVEDLLKNIPGVEVDRDGNIFFMGQSISRIRINGQDYLASDIKSLTSLLGAKFLDKIQFIDDYGDIAAITGRKTGSANKVLNLKTQSDFPRIINTRIDGSYDPWGKYYNLSGLEMIYKTENHLIANLNNSNLAVQSGKGMVINGGIDYFQQVGTKLTIAGSTEGQKQKSYQNSTTNEETVADEGVLNTLLTTDSDDDNKRYSFKTEIKYRPGSRDLYSVKASGQNNSISSISLINNTQTGYQYKTQHTERLTGNQLNDYLVNIIGLHGFNKKGRFITFAADMKIGNNNTDVDDNNSIRYYNFDNTLAKDSILHQLSSLKSNTYNAGFEMSYVEPLIQFSDFELKYKYLTSGSDNIQLIQWEDKNGVFSSVDSVSSNYNTTIAQNQYSISYHRNRDRFNYTLGGEFLSFSLKTDVLKKGLQFFPALQINYKKDSKSDLTLSYQGNSVFPTTQQLRVVPDLNNIQSPIYGNPGLKAGQEHIIRFDQKKVGINSFFLKVYGSTVRKQVVTNVVLVKDSFNTVKQETHFLNSDRNFSLGGEFLWSHEIEGKSQILSTSLKSSINKGEIYFDNIPYSSNNINLTANIKSEYVLKFGSINPSVSYILTRNEYEVNGGSVTNMQTLKFGLYNILRFKGHYIIESSFQDIYNFGYNAVFNKNYIFLDVMLIKRWLNSKITTAIQGQNLFNIKNTFSQNISGNSVTISQSSRIGRVVFLSVIFTFQNSK